MKKLALILLGIWFVIGNSCVLKTESSPLLSTEQTNTTFLRPTEQFTAVLSSHTDHKSCRESAPATLNLLGVNFYTTDYLGLNSGLFIYFSAALLLGLFYFSATQKVKISDSVILSENNAPLYLQFQRLQFYA